MYHPLFFPFHFLSPACSLVLFLNRQPVILSWQPAPGVMFAGIFFLNVIQHEAHTLLKQSGQIFFWRGTDIALKGSISSSYMMIPRYEPEQVFQWAGPTVRRP